MRPDILIASLASQCWKYALAVSNLKAGLQLSKTLALHHLDTPVMGLGTTFLRRHKQL